MAVQGLQLKKKNPTSTVDTQHLITHFEKHKNNCRGRGSKIAQNTMIRRKESSTKRNRNVQSTESDRAQGCQTKPRAPIANWGGEQVSCTKTPRLSRRGEVAKGKKGQETKDEKKREEACDEYPLGRTRKAFEAGS